MDRFRRANVKRKKSNGKKNIFGSPILATLSFRVEYAVFTTGTLIAET